MSFSIGIVGLPNIGKSTLFTALTAQSVETANYPFATIDPNVGVVEVPDDRLDAIGEIILPPKTTPTVIEFFDIAGLVKGAHTGEGLGNEFLSHIQRVDALVHLVRSFENPDIEHVEGGPNPERDYKIIVEELQEKDRNTLETQREKLENKTKSGDREAQEELALLLEIKEAVERHKPPKRAEAQKEARRLGLLSIKPELVVLNIDENHNKNDLPLPADIADMLEINVQEEADMVDLSEDEREELGLKSTISDIITHAYNILDLITFFTIKGGEELRAWTAPDGIAAPQAGGVVHNDFEEQFIKAEVLNWKQLVDANGWKAARQRGLIRTEGKEYTVQDGDVIEFKI